MHMYLVSRYYSLTQATTLSFILGLSALTACGLYVFIAIALVTIFRQLADRPQLQAVIT